MSRQTPIWALAGAVETVRATSVTAIMIVQSLLLLIENQLYRDERSVFCTTNNVK
jgi:hypothetical protein